MPPILASSITLIPFVAFNFHTFTLPFHGRCPSGTSPEMKIGHPFDGLPMHEGFLDRRPPLGRSRKSDDQRARGEL